MSLPIMILYALFSPETATVAYLGLHIAFAGVATYTLERLLGLNAIGSLIGAVSYAFAWVAPGSSHLVIFFPTAIWIIVAMIAVELAVRAASWPARLWSWLLAATSISQILAVWLGQGSYYAMLCIGAWIAYRTLLMPDRLVPIRSRLRAFAITGAAVLGFGFGIAAAVILPRWNAVSRSNLAGGLYDVTSAWKERQAGFQPAELVYELVGGHAGSLWWYVGAVAVALAFMAPVVARRWRPLPFFVLMTVLCLVLALPGPTPLNAAFGPFCRDSKRFMGTLRIGC